MDVITVAFPCTPEFVGVARAFTTAIFKDHEQRVQDAELIASELVTNSVVHSRSRHGGHITARYTIGEESGRIEIIDDGPDAQPIPADEADEHRRGLRFIVDSCADKWGQETEGGRSIYWAELHWTD